MKPLRNAAHEGRLNPKGITCLYASTDKNTAMAEIRRWLGVKISAGYFETTRELVVVDFSLGHDARLDPDWLTRELSAPEKEAAIWSQVDRAFSAPVTDQQSTAEYVPTPIIVETFRIRDYDGMVYRSLLGEGFNLALFDFDAAELVACGLYHAPKLSFSVGEDGASYHVARPQT